MHVVSRAYGRLLVNSVLRFISVGGERHGAMSVWYASSILGLILDGNKQTKQYALRVPLAVDSTEQFLAKLLLMFGEVDRRRLDAQVTVAILKLLCLWLWDCSPVVEIFMLHGPAMLIDLINSPPKDAAVHIAGLASMILAICLLGTDDSDFHQVLEPIVASRVGLPQLSSKLMAVGEHVAFRVAQAQNSFSLRPPRYIAEEEEWEVRLGLPALSSVLVSVLMQDGSCTLHDTRCPAGPDLQP